MISLDMSLIHLDLSVMLGPYKSNLVTGLYATSVDCWGQTFYCSDNENTEWDINNTRNS